MRENRQRDWLNWNARRHWLLWPLLIGSLTACSPISGSQYFCPPTITYDQSGNVKPDTYAVDRMCYKSMTEKLQACYTEAR